MTRKITGKTEADKTNKAVNVDTARFSKIPRWIFGPVVHPIPQFARDFILQTVGYRRRPVSAGFYAYAAALSRRHNRKQLTGEMFDQRIRKIEKWL